MKDPFIYEQWYKRTAAKEEVLSKAVYGLSEWKRSEIQNANLIANPWMLCYSCIISGIAISP